MKPLNYRRQTVISATAPLSVRFLPLVCEYSTKYACVQLDPTMYLADVKVSGGELTTVNIVRHDFHGEWNCTISPKAKTLQQ